MKHFFMAILAVVTFTFCQPKSEAPKKESNKAQTVEQKLISATKSIESNPTADAYYKRSKLYSELNEHKLALDDIGSAIKIDSINGKYYFELGKIYRKTNNINSSINACIYATKFNYNEADVYLLLGENYFIFRQYQAAIDNLNEALKRDQFNEQAYFYKGMVYKESGFKKEAISSFQTAIEQNPEYDLPYAEISSIYINDENYQLAEQYISSGLRFNPKNAFLWHNLGVSLQMQNNLDSAVYVYEKSFEIDSNIHLSALNLSIIYFEQSEYQKSLQKISRVLKLMPKNVEALYIKARNLEELGDINSAKEILGRILEINPDYKEAANRYKQIKNL